MALRLHLETTDRDNAAVADLAIEAFEISQSLTKKWLKADYHFLTTEVWTAFVLVTFYVLFFIHIRVPAMLSLSPYQPTINLQRDGSVACQERLGGLLRSYHRKAAA